jgi:amino-acid N-acetyltransferase
MKIFHKPRQESVRSLLQACSLPTQDLEACHFEHFFGCGPVDDPQGVVGVELHGKAALLRSLAVAQAARGQGCSTRLVVEAERYAREHGATAIYLLTSTARPLFERLGYAVAERAAAPDEIRATKEFASICPSSATFMVKQLGD